MLDPVDVQGGLRPDDKDVAEGLLLPDIGGGLVVDLVALGHGAQQVGVLAVDQVHQGHELVLFLDIVQGLGQDDHVFGIALGLDEFQGDRVGDAAVEQVPVAHGDDLRRQGHGGGGPKPVQVLVVTRQAVVVDGPAGADVSPHDVEVHGGVGIGLPVKDIQLVRDLPVAEVRSEEITGLDPRAHAAISWVLAKGQVVAQHPPDLVGFIVAAEHGPRRDANGPVKDDVLLHHHVDDARGEQAPHGAAFHHQSVLHGYLPFCARISFLS